MWYYLHQIWKPGKYNKPTNRDWINRVRGEEVLWLGMGCIVGDKPDLAQGCLQWGSLWKEGRLRRWSVENYSALIIRSSSHCPLSSFQSHYLGEEGVLDSHVRHYLCMVLKPCLKKVENVSRTASSERGKERKSYQPFFSLSPGEGLRKSLIAAQSNKRNLLIGRFSASCAALCACLLSVPPSDQGSHLTTVVRQLMSSSVFASV